MTKKLATLKGCNIRINLLRPVFLVVSGVFITRLFYIQVIQHDKYRVQAQEQYWEELVLPAKRGDILSSDGYPLATTQVSYLLYLEPLNIEDKHGTAYKLGTLLAEFNEYELEEPFEFYQKRILDLLESELHWVKLQNGLTPEEKSAVQDLSLIGVGFEEEPLRYYPEGTLASHVLGFVAQNEKGEPQGYFGVEGRLNGDLKGKPGRIIEETDAVGDPILMGGYKRVAPVDGRSVKLTINRAVQYIVERHLQAGVEEYGAVSGSVIVMDPFSGEVLAMANYPTYDPANFNDFENPEDEKKVERRNLSISQTYEPGSVMKPLTVAAAMDMGKISRFSTFTDSGPVQYSDYVIDNWDGKHHGVQDISELLQKSNNIGAAWVGHQAGTQGMYDYLQRFGIGTITGIELEGEDTGIIRPQEIWTDIDLATISFGQGVSATPLQVLNVFNSLANGGHLIQPKIVAELDDGEEKIEIPSKILSRAVSQETSSTMVDLLTEAVSGGESKYFNIKNYKIAGKTGTAQIPVGGKYDPSKTNATFVGFLTTSKRFTMIVKLEEPESSIYAAETAVPLWMDITRDLVKYFGIPPDSE